MLNDSPISIARSKIALRTRIALLRRKSVPACCFTGVLGNTNAVRIALAEIALCTCIPLVSSQPVKLCRLAVVPVHTQPLVIAMPKHVLSSRVTTVCPHSPPGNVASVTKLNDPLGALLQPTVAVKYHPCEVPARIRVALAHHRVVSEGRSVVE
jgi:hypothetical protein